ncbi:MAG: sugar phosphate isomerase/epimerase [Clostridia bacterium]|nr:sugar phosphate isomerase/epimerase [Clostridia bacterium]
MFRIGLSSCGKGCGRELFEQYAKAGITAMEVSPSSDEYDGFDFGSAGRLSKEYGVELWSFHLPFLPFGAIDISRPDLAGYTVRYFETLIRSGAAIGIKKFIVHPSGEPIDDADRPARTETAKKSLAALAEFASRYGAVICVEDLPRTCLGRDSGEIAELLTADERLRVCFDTNHLLTESPEAFIKKIGEKIVTTHVSDYDFIDEKHWLPGEGKVDWQSLVRALESVGYNGVWLYELGFRSPSTLTRARDLNCFDFVRNAEEIFSGAPLTLVPSEKTV